MTSNPLSIQFLCYDKALATGITLPMEMVAAVNAFFKTKRQSQRVIVELLGPAIEPVRVTGGLSLLPDGSIATAQPGDIIFVPPIWGNPQTVVRKNSEMLDWLRNAHQNGSEIVVTGTAVCLIAELGLLNNQPATTHWYYFEQFKKLYPQVNLQQKFFTTFANNIYCAGSINAQTDLVLYLIKQHFGEEVLSLVERHFSHEINRTYQTPYFGEGSQLHHDEAILEVEQWIEQHSEEEIQLEQLASLAKMSSRNLTRRFKQATGKTPLNYLLMLRLERAKTLLKQTNLTNSEIAFRVGFNDPAYFSRCFKQKFNTNVSQYRTLVRAKPFSLS